MTEAQRIRQFLRMVVDFGNMGTGEFLSKYPKCETHEGFGFIEKHARALLAKAGKPGEAGNG